MTDSERLIMISKYAGMSLNKLAKEIGITTSQTFYDIKAGKHGISKDLAEKIQARYLNISMTWLLTGEGEMLVADTTPRIVNAAIIFFIVSPLLTESLPYHISSVNIPVFWL